MENKSHFIKNEKNLGEMSLVAVLKEGHKAGESEHGTKILGISGGAISAITGGIAIIGEEFGEELLSSLGGGAFIGIMFMIYRFFKVSIEIEGQLEEQYER